MLFLLVYFYGLISELENKSNKTPGMGAAHGVLHCMGPDTHVLYANDLYSGISSLLQSVFSSWNLSSSSVKITDLAEVEREIDKYPTTALLWFEAISNPQLRVADVQVFPILSYFGFLFFTMTKTRPSARLRVEEEWPHVSIALGKIF